MQSPDWSTLNPMANEGERLAVLEKQVAMFEQLRREDADARHEIFKKLEVISSDLAVIKSRSSCPDPGGCVRLESALVDQNRRVGVLETTASEKRGERTILVGMASVIGAAAGGLIDFLIKK
jgi:hypothetical protein